MLPFFLPMMARSLFPRGLALVFLLNASTCALRITPDSPCSSVCGDTTTTTNSSDVVCNDFDYYRTSAGSTFMSCIECLQTSNATRDSDNDVSWYLCKFTTILTIRTTDHGHPPSLPERQHEPPSNNLTQTTSATPQQSVSSTSPCQTPAPTQHRPATSTTPASRSRAPSCQATWTRPTRPSMATARPTTTPFTARASTTV